MTEKRKRPPRDHVRPVTQILADLDSPDSSKREQVIGEWWDLFPHVETVLSLLLRGLDNADEFVRLQAARGLLLAFPSVEFELSRLVSDIVEGNERKVRLAAIERIIIILANVLGTMSGIERDDPASTGKQPAAVTEDLMEYAGRWVAWSRDRQRILAVADSFADVMEKAKAAGESDPYVKKATGVAPKAVRKPFAMLEGESRNILDDVKKVFPDPEAWLDAPNNSLGGEKPRDLVSTEREWEVRYLLRGIEDGITT